jgi:non-heme chloroperoxidase
MSTITTKDGVEIFYKDWGPKDAQPIVFHHGWPLTSDDWDTQMLFFLGQGYRVVAHDRRGHGRSSQVSDGHDMDHYAADAAAVVEHLDLRNAVHIGHSTGGGEATRYVARYGQPQGRVAKLVLIGAVPPLMLRTPADPGGLPLEAFDGLRKELAGNRAQFYIDFPSGPFYGYNRPGAKPSQAIIQNWWRQGMMGSAQAHYKGIKAFSETDFTEDLKIIEVPTLVMHGDDDQIVPIANSALLSVKLLKKGTLKVYPKFPHGLCTTHAEVVNPDLLAFINSSGQSQIKSSGNRNAGNRLKIVVIGGTGLIGREVVKILLGQGHEVVAGSPSSGINTVTGEGLAEALTGAQLVIDVANSPSFEDKAVMEFFEASGRNLLAAEKVAGVKHHVALSVVGTERMLASGYFRAKMAQENLIKASSIPYTIVRATQFFEFAGTIAQTATKGETVNVPPVMMQPIAAADVSAAVAKIALAEPLNDMVEVAGPEAIRQNEFVRQYLRANGDSRTVVTDNKAHYFGMALNDESLTPGSKPLFGPTRFEDWLRHSVPLAAAH